MRSTLCLFLAIALVPYGCIHTNPHEDLDVHGVNQSDEGFAHFDHDSLRVDYLVYTESKLPLEDFFARLANGEFDEAFKRANLRYVPAKGDNVAIKKLLAAGYVPVYLQVENRSETEVDIDPTTIELRTSGHRLAALSDADVPTRFSEPYPEAAAANIVNFVVATAVILAFVALIMAASKGKGGNWPISGGGYHKKEYEEEDELVDKNQSIFNDTTKTTSINYQDHLFPYGRIPPGSAVQGLVLFQIQPSDGLINKDELRLYLSEP